MSKISALRQRFVEDMNLAGLAQTSQNSYVNTIRCFVVRCGNISPEQMTEQQVEAYIRERHVQVARGTFQQEFGALRFLFCNTLLRDWAVFTKKKSGLLSASAFPSPKATRIAAR